VSGPRAYNLHHLQYFWVAAREGGVTAAARRLGVATATVSAQLAQLEADLGVRLFQRRGRGVVLTEAGLRAMQQADEVFAIVRALPDRLREPAGDEPRRLAIGVTDVLPKLLAREVIARVFDAGVPVRLVCREDHVDRLVGDLAVHELDVVLADAPVPLARELRAAHEVLLDSPVAWLAAPTLARSLRGGFPGSLEGQPVLLPTPDAALRREVDRWFTSLGIQPRIVAEIADSALALTFAESGLGAIPAPGGPQAPLPAGLEPIGESAGARTRCFGIALPRRLRDPLVRAILHPSGVQGALNTNG
jgi:LysR family transcriptional activator of nhaA